MRTACATHSSLITGSMPGIAASTRLTWLLGAPPKAVEAPENSLALEVTWAWTSMPTTTSQSPVWRPSDTVFGSAASRVVTGRPPSATPRRSVSHSSSSGALACRLAGARGTSSRRCRGRPRRGADGRGPRPPRALSSSWTICVGLVPVALRRMCQSARQRPRSGRSAVSSRWRGVSAGVHRSISRLCSMTASASISTSQSSSSSADDMAMVLAGRISPKASPCARPITSQSYRRVKNDARADDVLRGPHRPVSSAAADDLDAAAGLRGRIANADGLAVRPDRRRAADGNHVADAHRPREADDRLIRAAGGDGFGGSCRPPRLGREAAGRVLDHLRRRGTASPRRRAGR